jgi:O-methyltransferase involved in polyketide biosynthesis
MIEYDFSTIAANISPTTRFGWIGRRLCTDKLVGKFLERHPAGAVVDIGCGMDTNFENVDNGTLKWYDLDMPDVIGLRRKFFSETDRRRFISGSMLDFQWMNRLSAEEHVFFIAAGVLYYFEESQVRQLIVQLAEHFPGSEFLFDVSSPLGVRVANKLVIRGSGLDEKSFLKWGIKDINDLKKWDSRLQSVKRHSFFKGIRSRMDFKTRLQSHLSDFLDIMYMVHVKFQ